MADFDPNQRPSIKELKPPLSTDEPSQYQPLHTPLHGTIIICLTISVLVIYFQVPSYTQQATYLDTPPHFYFPLFGGVLLFLFYYTNLMDIGSGNQHIHFLCKFTYYLRTINELRQLITLKLHVTSFMQRHKHVLAIISQLKYYARKKENKFQSTILDIQRYVQYTQLELREYCNEDKRINVFNMLLTILLYILLTVLSIQ